MIGEGCDVGGRLWSCEGAALSHSVRLCGISAALRETRILVNSSEMSARSSISFTSIRTERLFAHSGCFIFVWHCLRLTLFIVIFVFPGMV